jgi:hypothetical protein
MNLFSAVDKQLKKVVVKFAAKRKSLAIDEQPVRMNCR